MKKIQLFVTTAFSLFLFACVTNPSLPEYNAGNTSGIIAIPEAFVIKGGPNKRGSYYTELRIQNIDTKESQILKIYYVPGSQIQYMKNISPGTYILDAIRTIPVPNPDIRFTNYDRKFYSLGGSVEVKPNQVSVVPVVFRAIQDSGTQNGSWQFFFRPFELEKDQAAHKHYEALINESNKDGQWVINWPWTTSS